MKTRDILERTKKKKFSLNSAYTLTNRGPYNESRIVHSIKSTGEQTEATENDLTGSPSSDMLIRSGRLC